VFFLLREVVHLVLESAGFYEWIYSSDALNAASVSPELRGRLLAVRKSLWAVSLAFLLQVGLILFFFYSQVGARPYQFGLTVHRLGINGLVGFLVWLVLTPLVLALNLAVILCYQALTHSTPEGHPLEQLGRAQIMPAEWLLIIFTATIAA